MINDGDYFTQNEEPWIGTFRCIWFLGYYLKLPNSMSKDSLAFQLNCDRKHLAIAVDFSELVMI